MSTVPSGRDGPDLPSKGVNVMRQFLTGMARDVPIQLKRSASYRKQIRRKKR